jgi:hypothetical protein
MAKESEPGFRGARLHGLRPGNVHHSLRAASRRFYSADRPKSEAKETAPRGVERLVTGAE